MPVSTPSELVIHDWPLPYESRLQQRALDTIDLVVIHCTELPDMQMTREFGERVRYADGTGNSGHYYIEENGTVYRFVAPRTRGQPYSRLQHAFDRHRDVQPRPLSALGRQQTPGLHDAVYKRANTTHCSRCCANCARISRACAISPATKISTAASNRPATIRRSCCRAARIPARCFHGMKSCRRPDWKSWCPSLAT